MIIPLESAMGCLSLYSTSVRPTSEFYLRDMVIFIQEYEPEAMLIYSKVRYIICGRVKKEEMKD